ncbi:hypothetical protein C8R48DRAFT_720036 [Suillus tomentosus]|nr:hypothetical protein C8R48DRAFT_720036 [Suillus tomentosus]
MLYVITILLLVIACWLSSLAIMFACWGMRYRFFFWLIFSSRITMKHVTLPCIKWKGSEVIL